MYQDIFSKALEKLGRSDVEPAIVEGVARLGHGTLNHLSMAELETEAEVTIALIEEAGMDVARSIADSFGLLPAGEAGSG
jgi:hypothetical protein